jgi:hypothetical protein
MGQINLFASKLTENMRDFLSGYEENKLWFVTAVRYLETDPYPHVNAVDDRLDHNYILVEVLAPLEWNDITWLLRGIVYNEHECDNRKTLLRYAIERTLNPGVDIINKRRHLRRQVNGDTEWAKVAEFRRLLEVAAMAFRFFKKDFKNEKAFIDVQRHSNVLLIEYDGRPAEEDDVEDDQPMAANDDPRDEADPQLTMAAS